MVHVTKITSDTEKNNYSEYFENILKLWNLTPDKFNEWRRKNDLPVLYREFQRELPRFQEWLDSYNLTYEENFLKAPHTGDLFIGTGIYEFVEYTIKDIKLYAITKSFDDDRHISFMRKFNKIEILSKKKFLPYLSWAEINIEKDFSKLLQYNHWSGDESCEPSVAFLFPGFEVQKIGQIKLSDIATCNRNLDFMDLDYIEFSGNFQFGEETKINFSSCRGWNILSSGIGNFTLRYCNLGQFKCLDSLVHFYFYKCRIWEPSFVKTNISAISFDNCDLLNPSFDGCDIVPYNFHYIPELKDARFFGEKENYRIFRHAFQSIGQMSEAKKYFYLERKYERKNLLVEITGRDFYIFLSKKIDSIIDTILKKKIAVLFNRYISILTTRSVYNKFILICKYIASLIDDAMWGYGEKPIRIFRTSVFVILLYATIYYFYGPTQTIGSKINSIYFSVVTFTTLGYGDILPIGSMQKIICGSEAFLGACLIGLLIAGYSNRLKY